ncbi:hypothetical protein [Nocardiopsis baichengensis]|uniref:hypothetical protein n=1 Tax=Nocardiopsis baichengensis TaxID=280240 RepID=UPI00034BFEEB|nr:hypothetical protein [Nocardiopsis baichengensis]
MDQEDLDWENGLVLDLVQAQLGLISSNIVAIAIRADKEQGRIELLFWAHEENEELAEDIEDIIFELEVLRDGINPAIESEVNIGRPDPAELRSYGRMVYRSKD